VTAAQELTERSVTTLAPEGSSASTARRVVEAAVDGTTLQPRLDEALLLVTELVTNAIVHAGTRIELRVQTGIDALRVEVIDQSPGLLAPQPPSDTREGGRGLLLLDAIATEWGTRHFGWGKSVWFALDAAEPKLYEPRELVAPPASRRARTDIGWLIGLPADIEERMSPDHVVAELLHRLADGMGIEQAWVYASSTSDEHRWECVATHDPLAPAPGGDAVRRATERASAKVPDTGVSLLALQGASGAFGALALQARDALSDQDAALVRLVAERIAVVLRDDRARSTELRSRGSLALLAEASEMFAGTLDVQLAMTLATQLVVPRFARWAAAWATHEQRPRLAAVAHADENRLGAMQAALAGADGEALALRLANDLVEQRPNLLHGSELPTDLIEERSGQVLGLPLVARRRALGVLVVGRPANATFGPDDVGLLNDLARRTAVAIDSARLYEESTVVARALQASLLPASLPRGPAVEFGARYAAAGEGNEVGGDFYDVFELGEAARGWGVAIGDVCGKGPEAAAITGMARDVLRLLMRDGSRSPAALRRLNETILDLGDRGRFATATLGTVAPDGECLKVTFTLAGHPAPVIVRRSGAAGFVGRAGTLLGVFPDLDLVEDTVVLEPGDALVFYTDGVTERRSNGLMFGDQNLLDCVRQTVGGAADQVAGALEDQVQRFGPARDDLAVLVVRCTAHSVDLAG
jgi:phosphoserine phosphatase RsbU/P